MAAAEPTPLFDANAFLGRAPDRQPGAPTDAPALLAAMRALGIQKALVYHAAAVRADMMSANRRLLDDTEVNADLLPCWVLLPPGTHELPQPEGLVAEMLGLGVRAARCFPRAHGYQVRERVMGGLLAALEQRRVPVFLDYGVVHWSERVFDWDGIAEVCTAHPALPVVLVRPGLMTDRDLYPLLEHCSNLYVETSYYFQHQGLRSLVARFGPRRLLWGTGMPTYAPGASIALLTYSGLGAEEQTLVGGGNLERLLGEVSP